MRRGLLPPLTLAVCAALGLAAVYALAPPWWGHDLQVHQRWQHHFAAQLLAGEPYPRWLAGLNEGFGSPAFFVYPPLPHYAAALFLPLPGFDAMLRVQAAMLLALALSGITMYAWLATLVRSRAALAGALVYMLAPYHLYVDLYRRAALAELWAFVWPPLALLALGVLRERPWRSMLVASLPMAGLFLSHPPSAVMLVPVVALVAGALGGWRTAIAALAASAFGAALAAVYLAPALTHEPFTNMAAMFQGHGSFRNWMLGGEGLLGCGAGRHAHACQLVWVIALQYAAAALLLVAAWRLQGSRRLLLGIAAALLVLLLLLQSAPGAPLWDALPLLQKMQFPWRLLVAQTMLLALLAALAFEHIVARAAVVALVGSVALLALMDRSASPLGEKYERPPTLDTVEVEEYRLGDPQLMLVRLAGGNAVVVEGVASLSVSHWKARDVALQVEAASPVRIALRQFNDRGWQFEAAAARGVTRPLSAALPVAAFELPAGQHAVRLRLAAASPEWWGAMVSALAMLAWVLAMSLERAALRRWRH